MSYNANIPIATDTMAKSQRQINANFQAIANIFAENHINLNAEFQGMHRTLTFREQSGDPTTAADQVALYTKAVNGAPNLFFRPKSNQTPIQLTYPSVITGIQSIGPPVVYFTKQNTFVAGPFIIYSGIIKAATQGQAVVLTPTSTLIYAGLVIKTNKSNANYNAIGVISGSGFTIRFQTGLPAQDIYYFAIGKP